MSFLEGIVEKALTTVGVDADTAEKIGDLASCGANIAMGNYAGAAADGLDFFELDDDVPWLAQGLEMYGGDPMAAQLGTQENGFALAQELGIKLPVHG
jgi:hypothetical protein